MPERRIDLIESFDGFVEGWISHPGAGQGVQIMAAAPLTTMFGRRVQQGQGDRVQTYALLGGHFPEDAIRPLGDATNSVLNGFSQTEGTLVQACLHFKLIAQGLRDPPTNLDL